MEHNGIKPISENLTWIVTMGIGTVWFVMIGWYIPAVLWAGFILFEALSFEWKTNPDRYEYPFKQHPDIVAMTGQIIITILLVLVLLS